MAKNTVVLIPGDVIGLAGYEFDCGDHTDL